LHGIRGTHPRRGRIQSSPEQRKIGRTPPKKKSAWRCRQKKSRKPPFSREVADTWGQPHEKEEGKSESKAARRVAN